MPSLLFDEQRHTCRLTKSYSKKKNHEFLKTCIQSLKKDKQSTNFPHVRIHDFSKPFKNFHEFSREKKSIQETKEGERHTQISLGIFLIFAI